MEADNAVFLWVALVSLCCLGFASWFIVEAVYLGARIYSRLRYWWLYGRHGAAYGRSIRALGRRSETLRAASARFGGLRFRRTGGDK